MAYQEKAIADKLENFVFYVLLFVLSGLLSACGLNNVKKLNSDAAMSPDRSVIIYGIRVEGKWDATMFSVNLDEYDLQSQRITGNCFRFNRTEAMVPSTEKSTQYFAFEVHHGHFVVSPFINADRSISTTAFSAQKGNAVYIGTFLYDKNKKLILQRDFDRVARQLQNLFPRFRNIIKEPELVEVTRPSLFLCAP